MLVENPRILQVITGSDWGGAQQHLLWLTEGLRERGFAVSVACQPGGYLVERLERLGIPVFPLPRMARRISPAQDWQTFRDLRRILRQGQFHLVHAHSSKAGALARLAAASLGLPAVFTAHGLVFGNEAMPGWKRRAYALAERALGLATAHLIAVSQADGRLALAQGLVPSTRLTVIPNGVPIPDERQSSHLREEVRLQFGIPAGAPVIGTIARFHPDKDLATWLAAAALVHKTRPDAEFLLIGDGPEAERLRAVAAQLGLKDRITWAGEQPDAARLLPAMDVFLLSSVKEGMPITLLEAMAWGLPVVATRVGGIPELVEDGRNGLLAPPRDARALAVAALSLLAEPKVINAQPGAPLSQVGSAGRQRVREGFSVDAMVGGVIGVYEKVLGERGGRR